ncbi:hypothetical protein R1flu_004814 [Riccia fluitans]|uniref:Uncharacterized protein n=1 Tax=Riccia fluitans TaxID=41844 RepID=A0ABD1YRD3_9MARC
MSHSSNLDKLDQEASMQDQEASTSAVQVYQPLECLIVPSFLNYGITLKELSVLSRDEVFPYVNTHRLKADGIIKISGELFHPTGSNIGTTFECIVDLSAAGRKYKKDSWQDIAPWFGFSLTHSQPHSEGWVVDDFKKYSLEGHPDGYALDKQVRLVINQVQRMVGKANRSFCSTTLVLLAVAHVDPRMADYRPDWHMWVSFEIRSRLGHGGKDKFLGGKFREGWEAIVRLIIADFLAKQAIARHEPLIPEARNAFTNTRAEWDSEKGELVHEREALNEELNKAKEMAAKVEQRTKVVRLEKEALQQQYAKDKAEWERKNTQLIEEVGQLHEEKKRNATREG